MSSVEYDLADASATLALGRALARAALAVMDADGHPPALLLTGPLGAGKTTLVRGLVQGLPGADQAEVASPSFNLVNLYPTQPPVAHFDLYRLDKGAYLDDAEEWLAGPGSGSKTWALIEWAERLPAELTPQASVAVELVPETGGGRRAKFTANSKHALAYLAALGEMNLKG